MLVFIMVLSTFLQFTASIVALRLIPMTKGKGGRAWIALSMAFFLMGTRRSITLYYLFAGDGGKKSDLITELLALLISVLVLLGLSWTKNLFKMLVEERISELKRANEALQIENIERRHAEAELKRHRDILESLTLRDGLTNIANRRCFDEFLDQEWRRASRSGRPLSLIMIDIDFFKLYNDNYGHSAGDECLKRVAVALCAACKRPEDLVARYGGEEFACILPETYIKGALYVANCLQESINSQRIPHAFSSAADYVTISIGCATINPSPKTSPGFLIETADRLLYESKKKGRNQILYQDWS
jgi:diguanylate cyclase (GGDEF)-like protein